MLPPLGEDDSCRGQLPKAGPTPLGIGLSQPGQQGLQQSPSLAWIGEHAGAAKQQQWAHGIPAKSTWGRRCKKHRIHGVGNHRYWPRLRQGRVNLRLLSNPGRPGTRGDELHLLRYAKTLQGDGQGVKIQAPARWRRCLQGWVGQHPLHRPQIVEGPHQRFVQAFEAEQRQEARTQPMKVQQIHRPVPQRAAAKPWSEGQMNAYPAPIEAVHCPPHQSRHGWGARPKQLRGGLSGLIPLNALAWAQPIGPCTGSPQGLVQATGSNVGATPRGGRRKMEAAGCCTHRP